MANDVLARLSVQIDAQTAQFGAALKLLDGNLRKFQSNVSANTSAISSFEKGIQGIQRTMGSLGLAFGAFQIASVVKDAANITKEFGKQMSEVEAITNATSSQMDKLRRSAIELGGASLFSATQVGALQEEFAKLGFNVDEILAATEATIQLATATGEDLAKSADVVGSTLRAFGLSAQETQRIVDVMAESFNRSSLGLDNFAESMKYVAPIARAANISVEETTALLGVLADAGIRGSQAGTALRRIITDLAKDGRPLAERLRELADGGLTFGGAMDEVGRNAQSALLVLTKNVSAVEQMEIALNSAEGAAKKAADTMGDNLAGDVDQLAGAWESLILSFEEGDNAMRSAVQLLTQLVGLIQKFSDTDINKTTVDLVRTFEVLGEKMKLTRSEGEFLFNELNRLKTLAILDGQPEQAAKYAAQIEILNGKFDGLGQKVGFVGPLLNNAFKTDIFDKVNNDGTVTVGIIEDLEAKAKGFGDAIKKATSIPEIRKLQHDLEEVQLRIKSLLEPSIAPEPIVMAVVIDFPELDVVQEQGRALLTAINSVIPAEGIVIPVRPDFLAGETLQEGATGEAVEKQLAAIEEAAAQTAMSISDALNGAVEAAISGQASFVDAIARNTLELLAEFQKQALGAALVRFFSTPGTPFPLLLAGAGLAIAAVKGLFSKIGAPGGPSASAAAVVRASGSGFRREQPDFRTERAGVQLVLGGEFRMRGNDMVLQLDNQNIRKQRIG